MAHPSHDNDVEPVPESEQLKNDFALLELVQPVSFNRDVHAACLPSIPPHEGTKHDIVSHYIYFDK